MNLNKAITSRSNNSGQKRRLLSKSWQLQAFLFSLQ